MSRHLCHAMWKDLARRYHADVKPAVVLALFALALASSCAKKSPPGPKEEIGNDLDPPASGTVATEVRWYRVEIAGDETSELRVVFQLGLPWPLQATSEAQIVNGKESIVWTMECLAKKHCIVAIPVYAAALDLEFDSDTTLKGLWRRDPLAYDLDAPLKGVRVAGPELAFRTEAGLAPSADFSGEWLVNSGDFGRSRASFEQGNDGTIAGTIMPKGVGDARFLAGRVAGNVARLSTFDGQRAYAVEMVMDPVTQTFAGSWVSLTFETRSFDGARGQVPSVLEELYVDEFVSSDRRVSIPELDALLGKPVIVDLFGTWCPTCLDMVPTLLALHHEFAPDGLEILSIAYEMTDDEGFANKRLEAFHKRFKPTWPTVLRLGEAFEALLPREIEPSGFPITLFVNRDGTVHRMNTGFVSAASEEGHKTMVDAFHRWTTEIMASEPAPH